eukprot:scpid44969/ scgid0335/ RNA pseudouridylate synthase domain-containing protein 2
MVLFSLSCLCLERRLSVIIRTSMSAAAQVRSPGSADGDPVLEVPTTNNSENASSKEDPAPLVGQVKRKLSNLERHQMASERKRRKKERDQVEKLRNTIAETSVSYRNGLRIVRPYMFVFATSAKERWFGRTIVDVFTQEFRVRSKENLLLNIEAGNMSLSGKVAQADSVVLQGDLLNSRVHRHEPPVTGQRISIIHSDDDVTVIDKPSSIPVHPTGPYRHNTIQMILEREFGLHNLRTIHRLDRLTSGVLIFAKSYEKVRELAKIFAERQMQKTYLARVVGEFPSGEVVVDEPIGGLTPKFSIVLVHKDGKPSKTTFQRLHYDGVTSVVKCLPHQGRMHQIRVHLLHLGHPIINDPIYNHPAWRNPALPESDPVQQAVFVLKHLLVSMCGPEEGAREYDAVLAIMRSNDALGPSLDEPDRVANADRDDDASRAASTVAVATGQAQAVAAERTTTAAVAAGREVTASSEESCSRAPTETPMGASCSRAPTEMPVATPAPAAAPEPEQCARADQSDQAEPQPCRSSVSTGSAPVAGATPVLTEAFEVTEKRDALGINFSSGVELQQQPDEFRLVDELPLATPPPTSDSGYYDLCWKCKLPAVIPKPGSLVMYLHALSYEGEGFKYESQVPAWANEDFQLPEFLSDPDAMAHISIGDAVL